MKFTSILALYVLFWWLCLFLVLPMRLKRKNVRAEQPVPGQAESAPPQFSPKRTALWTTIVSATLFGLFYLNYVMGWVGPGAFDFYTAHQHLHM